MAKEEEDEFTWMHLTIQDHFEDLMHTVLDGDLMGIVSQSDGGIIAYANGHDHAEQIVTALRVQKALNEATQAFEEAAGGQAEAK